MHTIITTEYGYHLTFEGSMNAAEMEAWRKESEQTLSGQTGKFGTYIDMRNLRPLADDAQAIMVKGQQLYQKAGMQRSAVAVANSVTAMQFRRLARESGIYHWERYVSPDIPDWEKKALEWVISGKDSDAPGK